MCPGSSDPFFIVTYYIKWVTYFLDRRYNYFYLDLLDSALCSMPSEDDEKYEEDGESYEKDLKDLAEKTKKLLPKV